MFIRCRIPCCYNVDNIVTTALLGIPPETHSADGGAMNLSVGKPSGTWGYFDASLGLVSPLL